MLAGEQYHVFNHANGRENLFLEEKNYVFFLEKLEQYILPVCKMYAYCLLPNHFHLVMEVRSENYLNALWNSNPGMSLPQDKLQYKTSKAFANFFSSYTQSFNKVYNRKGSLFIPSMKIKLITDELSFCKVVHYTHANPVHHGLTGSMQDWKNSSYRIFLSNSPTKIDREYVLDMFGGRNAFIKYHQQSIDLKTRFLE